MWQKHDAANDYTEGYASPQKLTHLCPMLLVCPLRYFAASPTPPSTYSCIPAAQVSAFAGTTVAGASANWSNPACFAATTSFAWWGEKCGPSGSQIQWAGVYAYDKTSGAVVTDCVKFRPSQATPSADVVYWLGSCGQAPAAAPDVPTRVCLEPFSGELVLCCAF